MSVERGGRREEEEEKREVKSHGRPSNVALQLFLLPLQTFQTWSKLEKVLKIL